MLFSVQAALADLQLVTRGKARTVIIIPEDAGFVTDSAAREMQAYLKKISGADVPIYLENSFSFGPDYHWLDSKFPVISIGRTELAAAAGLSVDNLGPEGFLIETKNNALFILGREERMDTTQLRSTKWQSLHWPLRRRGTLFGVYTFLEDYLGVRWLWPGDLGEIVPRKADIAVGEIHRVVRYDSAIAELVAAKQPDKRISMFAYAHWKEPAVEAKLHPNVVVVYVGEYTHGYLYAPDRDSNYKLWDGWARMVEGKMLWRPNMPESLGIPIVYAHQWAEDFHRFLPKMWGANVDALRGSWASAGLTQYVMAKLMWDPDRDVDAIIDDYCGTGFGAAATPIRQYFDTLEKYTAEAATLAPEHGYHKFCPWAHSYYTAERLGRLESLLDDATSLAGEDKLVSQRVQFLRTAIDWTKTALPAWAIYDADGDREEARPLVQRKYAMLKDNLESYAIYSGYLHSKITWMWKQFFGEEAEEDWSRAF